MPLTATPPTATAPPPAKTRKSPVAGVEPESSALSKVSVSVSPFTDAEDRIGGIRPA